MTAAGWAERSGLLDGFSGDSPWRQLIHHTHVPRLVSRYFVKPPERSRGYGGALPSEREDRRSPGYPGRDVRSKRQGCGFRSGAGGNARTVG